MAEATAAVNVRAQFGKPKYGQKTGHKTWRIQEEKPGTKVSNVYRILPPIKSGLEDGTWAIFLSQHFGYSGVDKADASKTKARPFACPKKENFTTKMVTVPCAECDKNEAQRALQESRKAALEAEGKDEEEIDSMLAPLKSYNRNHNQDRKWYVNVMNEAGEFGVLAIPHKAFGKLKSLIKRLQEEDGVEPIGVAEGDVGAWFDFRRTGKGRNTDYDVLVVQESVDLGNGRKGKAHKPAPLSDKQLEQAFKDCPDLVVGALMRVVTPEQVQMLVASSGDPEEVDAILGTAQRVESSASPAKPKLSAAHAVAQAVKPPAAPDEEEELMRRLSQVQAKKAAGTKMVAKAPEPEDEDEDLSPEELEKLFPSKK